MKPTEGNADTRPLDAKRPVVDACTVCDDWQTYAETLEKYADVLVQEVERLTAAWKKDNLCGICPYRQAVQAENERLTEREATALNQRDHIAALLRQGEHRNDDLEKALWKIVANPGSANEVVKVAREALAPQPKGSAVVSVEAGLNEVYAWLRDLNRPGLSERSRRNIDWLLAELEAAREREKGLLAVVEAAREVVQREARSEYSSIYAAPGEFAAILRGPLAKLDAPEQESESIQKRDPDGAEYE